MICIDCVSPKPLKAFVSNHGLNHDCQYCGKNNIAIDTKVLFDYILERIDENTASQEDLSDYEYTLLFDCGSDNIACAFLDVVLAEWADLGNESYYDDLYNYAPLTFKSNTNGINRCYFQDDGSLEKNLYEKKWENFVSDVRHSHRFFNPNAKAFLDSVFAFLCDNNNMLKPDCIRTITKGMPLYRARSATTYEDIKKIVNAPASQLGPTPRDRATNQRMTPNGISALYCALERDTCLSEIRSITGDNVVSIAMTPTNHLKLLDLTKLDLLEPPTLTLLEKGFRDAIHLKTFISSLVRKMSKPKGRNDDLSYLSTQIVFEYLRTRLNNQVSGLVFPSVQTGERGTNVVLFPEASVVSDKNYENLSDYEIAETIEPDFEPEKEEPFENEAKLYCISGSMRFHKVKAIETRADEYTQIVELFMSDLDKKRLGYR